MYRMALECNEIQLGSQHPETLKIVTLIGELTADQNQFDEAEKMFRRALVNK